MTATGLFSGDPLDPRAPYRLAEIATPDRRASESDVAWNARRFAIFSHALLDHLRADRCELLVIEVTSHAHRSTTRGDQRTATTRGLEYRAGLGLGRALGWIDGLLVLASAYGCVPIRVETIEAKTAKLRVAGSQGAPKAAVKDRLQQLFGWDLHGWKESQVDALAVGLGYLREAEGQAQEARVRGLAAAQDQARAPRRRRAPAL